jgi:hypothetical protein
MLTDVLRGAGAVAKALAGSAAFFRHDVGCSVSLLPVMAGDPT